MPAGIPWVFGAWKADRERSDTTPSNPISFSYQLIKRSAQRRCIDCLQKWFLGIKTQPYNRFRPRTGISRNAARVFPQYLPPLVCPFTGKGIVQPDISILDKLLNLGMA